MDGVARAVPMCLWAGGGLWARVPPAPPDQAVASAIPQNNTATGEEEEHELLGKVDKGVLSLGKVHKEYTGHYRCKGLDLDTMETLTADAELVVNCKECTGHSALALLPGARTGLGVVAEDSPSRTLPRVQVPMGRAWQLILTLFPDIEGLKVTKESPEPVLEGHNLTLTCEARGSRPLAFHWHKDKARPLPAPSPWLGAAPVGWG